MAVTTQSAPPVHFYAGETVRFTVSETDHPATAWTLSFALRGVQSSLAVAGVVSGSDFTVTLTAAQTTALKPGIYSAAAIFTETATTEVESTRYGLITVGPNIADSTTGPRRTAYEAARTKLEALSVNPYSSVSFNGQSFSAQNISEFQQLVDRLHIDALSEDVERGLAPRGGLVRIQTRI